MQHNFMPGDVVKHNSHGTGTVIGRGASRGKYWVQVRFLNGSTVDFVNDEIKTLKKS
jgi:hypothetical protein